MYLILIFKINVGFIFLCNSRNLEVIFDCVGKPENHIF